MSAPVVHAWMRKDGDGARRLGDALTNLGTSLDEKERELAVTAKEQAQEHSQPLVDEAKAAAQGIVDDVRPKAEACEESGQEAITVLSYDTSDNAALATLGYQGDPDAEDARRPGRD